jgi:hypothetical protein
MNATQVNALAETIPTRSELQAFCQYLQESTERSRQTWAEAMQITDPLERLKFVVANGNKFRL